MYVRGIDKISDLSFSSVIASVITICLNVSFLAFLHWGLVGYFMANIIGPMVQSLYLIVKAHILGDIHLEQAYQSEKNEMVNYSKPLIANSIAWWVNNFSDRYIVVIFVGWLKMEYIQWHRKFLRYLIFFRQFLIRRGRCLL